jgi:hypothetical protein
MDYRTDVGYEGPHQAAMLERGQSELNLIEDLSAYLKQYARERPETVACVCFALGFLLGWRLKPW